MSEDRMDGVLDRLRAAPVEPPTVAFADALEERLRSQHAARSTRTPRHGPARRRSLRVAAVAAAVVLAIGAAAALRPDSGPVTVVLASAHDATVVFPDGRVVEATAGLDLPDGTLIITGTDGGAVVAGVEIPPDSLAVVDDGRVRLLDTDLEPGRTAPPPTIDRPATTTTQVQTPTTGSPPTTRPPTVTTTTTTQRPPPSSTTTTQRRPAVASLTLAAERVDRRTVALRWSAYAGDGFARYVVVRTLSDDGEPPEPGSDAAAVFTTTSPSTRAFRDQLPAGTTHAAYRVIVLDPGNAVIGASPVTRV